MMVFFLFDLSFSSPSKNGETTTRETKKTRRRRRRKTPKRLKIHFSLN